MEEQTKILTTRMKKIQKVICVKSPDKVNEYINSKWTVVSMTPQHLSITSKSFNEVHGFIWVLLEKEVRKIKIK